MSDPEQKKKDPGCCGTGCVILIVCAVVLIAGAGFGYYELTERVHDYTAGSRETIPVENSSQQEYDALVKKMDVFKHLPPGSDAMLSITAHDLNVLIAQSPQWNLLPGKVRITIANGQVGLIGSIPFSSIPRLRDQYWNGALYFVPSIEGKVFHATITSLTSDTRELPKEDSQAAIAILEPNLNNRLLGDPVIGTVFIKAETLKVEGDALVLTSAK
ncbi:MAG: hypothetical protein WCD79_11915 [Chthoniobacteraceae bacterium]